MDQVVRLDIGGEKQIAVKRSLLTKVTGSALEAMFSGRHELPMVDNRVFVDRDPEAFSLLITYLRNDYNMPAEIIKGRYDIF